MLGQLRRRPPAAAASSSSCRLTSSAPCRAACRPAASSAAATRVVAHQRAGLAEVVGERGEVAGLVPDLGVERFGGCARAAGAGAPAARSS